MSLAPLESGEPVLRRTNGDRLGLSEVSRPRGRDLDGPELESFVAELAERPELWIDLIHHDPSRRSYQELIGDEHVTAWLICWMEDHDTGFHDHDVSSGAVAVLSGAVREERLRMGAYEVGEDGVLARHPVASSEELRPHRETVAQL